MIHFPIFHIQKVNEKIGLIFFWLVQVIFETSRLATIVNGVLRKTTKDMEMNGELCRLKLYNS